MIRDKLNNHGCSAGNNCLIFLGKESQIHFILLTNAIFPFFNVQTAREETYLFYCCHSLFCLALLMYFNFSLGPKYEVKSRAVEQLLLLTSFSFTFLVVLRITWSFLSVRERQEALLIEKNNRIREEINKKNSLINLICHDIATPLSLALGSSQLLARGLNSIIETEANADNITSLKDLNKSSFNAQLAIERLVRSVREIHFTESGKRDILIESVSVKKVLEQSCEVFGKSLDRKDISIECRHYLRDNTAVIANEFSF